MIKHIFKNKRFTVPVNPPPPLREDRELGDVQRESEKDRKKETHKKTERESNQITLKIIAVLQQENYKFLGNTQFMSVNSEIYFDATLLVR